MDRSFLLGVTILVLLASLCGCGADSDPIQPPVGPTALTLNPSQGSPGTVVTLEGIDPSSLGNDLRVEVDGTEGNVSKGPNGELLATIPVFVAADGSLSPPPSGAVDLELFDGDTLIARAEAAFTITELPTAPGAANQLVESLGSIARDLQAISLALATEPGDEQAYATAIPGAIEELLFGEDDRSLTSQLSLLERGTTGELELLEGFLAASPLLTQLENVATLMAGLAESAKGLPTAHKTTFLTDAQLATRMQLYVMVRDFGQQVVGNTASTWGQWVASVAGGLGVAGAGATVLGPGLAVAGTISAILGVANFAINNVALGYLPSQIDVFEVVVGESIARPGEVVDTEVWIHASNNPPPISLLDLVGQVLTAMGIAAGNPARETLRNSLDIIADYYLGIVRSFLSAYATANPDADVASDVASIPPLSWRAQVTDTRFVDPRTHTSQLIAAGENNIMVWRCLLDVEGEGRIYGQIKSGPAVTSLPQLPGYEYNAGAFGDQILTTETKTILIAPALVVTASMDPQITPAGQNGLEVRVGTLNAVGETIWREGIQIDLVATGGSVNPSQGQTGADGRFDTFVTLSPGGSSVDVDVVATDAFGGSATASASASVIPMEIEVLEWDPAINSASPNQLRFRVHRGDDAVSTASVQVDVTGGSASPANGSTNANGQFTTDVTADSGVASVLVEIAVSQSSETVELQLEALAEGSSGQVQLTKVEYYAEVSARTCCNDTVPQGGREDQVVWETVTDFDGVGPTLGFSTSVSASSSAGGEFGDGTASGQATHDSQLQFDSSGFLTSLEFIGFASGMSEATGNGSGVADCKAWLRLEFEVSGGDVVLQLEADASSSAETYFNLEGTGASFNLFWAPPSGLAPDTVFHDSVLSEGTYALFLYTRTNVSPFNEWPPTSSLTTNVGFGTAPTKTGDI